MPICQTPPLPLLASFYGSRARKTLVLTRIEGGHHRVVREIPVAGVREARRVAEAEGARRWNF